MKHIFTFFTILFTLSITAQEKDSLTKKTINRVTSKFPSTRTFDIQYEQLGSNDFKSEMFGDKFQEGRFDNHQKLKIAANLPFFKTQRLILSGSLRYKYEKFNSGYTENKTVYYSGSNILTEYHYISASANATYIGKLFKKTIVYNGTILVDGNEKSVQRLKGMASGIMVLKKNERTTITAGLVAILDVSSIIPVMPIFTYEHQFENSLWSVDVVSPQHFYLKRNVYSNGMLSFGAELSSDNFYVNLTNTQLDGMYEFNQLGIKSGISYEHKIGKDIFLNFKTGINNFITGRLTKRGEKTSKYIFDIKQDPAFYFNVGISYNPFQ